MAFVLSFVPHKSTKTPQNKRFIDFPSFFTGQNSTFAAAKQCSAKDLIGSKVFLDIIFSGFVPFLSRLRNIGERQKLEVIENKRVTIDKIGRNAVTTSNHQKGFSVDSPFCLHVLSTKRAFPWMRLHTIRESFGWQDRISGRQGGSGAIFPDWCRVQ